MRLVKQLLVILLAAPLLMLLVACKEDSSAEESTPSAGSTLITSSPVQEPTAPSLSSSPTRQTGGPPPPGATPSPSPTASASQTPGTDPEPTPTAAPKPFTDPAAIKQDMLDLQKAMQAAVDSYWVPGVYSVAVTDLQTGETVSVRGGERQLSACSINLFVLFQSAIDVEAGRLTLERVDALMRATTWSSNAKTARDLYVIAGDGDGVEGVRRVHALVESLELDGDVVLDHPPAFREFSLNVEFNNYVTAVSMNRALAALWAGEIVNEEMRDYLLEVLVDVKPGLNYLTAVVPEGTVSHKNGFFLGSNGYVDNDVGIIRLQRGDKEYAYALSFFSQQVPSEYGDIVLGQQLGQLAYEVMAARYPEG